MKQIRIILETDEQNIGYILTPETQRCISGKFDKDCKDIIEKSQDGKIVDPETLCKQIYYVLLAGIKNS